MSTWRVVGTDTERDTGVGEVCQKPVEHAAISAVSAGGLSGVDGLDVYDCCPGPHIECWNEKVAEQVAKLLNEAAAEWCS